MTIVFFTRHTSPAVHVWKKCTWSALGVSTLCVLCIGGWCEILGSWRTAVKFRGIKLALTVIELCIFQLTLERASEEPDNYIILSLVKSKYKIKVKGEVNLRLVYNHNELYTLNY